VVADEWINPVVDVELRTMLGRMNRTSSESRSTGRIRTRPNSEEAKECGDGIQEMEFFG
jgi:hypothetical protein